MRVLMIGGTVFIGKAIATRLLAEGHEVTLFHRGESENRLTGVAEILGNRVER